MGYCIGGCFPGKLMQRAAPNRVDRAGPRGHPGGGDARARRQAASASIPARSATEATTKDEMKLLGPATPETALSRGLGFRRNCHAILSKRGLRIGYGE